MHVLSIVTFCIVSFSGDAFVVQPRSTTVIKPVHQTSVQSIHTSFKRSTDTQQFASIVSQNEPGINKIDGVNSEATTEAEKSSLQRTIRLGVLFTLWLVLLMKHLFFHFLNSHL